MTASERGDVVSGMRGSGVSDQARRAGTARTVRRVLAVPFWALLAICVVSWPCASVMPDGVWNVARTLGTLLLTPVATARAIATSRFLGPLDRIDPGGRGMGCVVSVGLFFGTFLFMGAAEFLAPALTPTVAVTATVAECHPGVGRGATVACTGSWTADGTTVTGRPLPLAGTPGGTERFLVRRDDAHATFVPLTGRSEALGAGLGVGGAVILGAGVFGLVKHTRLVRRRIDDVLTR
jgi:hypothetical protein